MTRRPAAGKINLALVVGPPRPDGRHELVTVYQRIALCDRISIAPGADLTVDGFQEDTLVRRALERLAATAGVEPCWAARIQKRLPVAAGVGGGSSDAATALRLANDSLAQPLESADLDRVAAAVGSDVPFFLRAGPQLGTGDGTRLEPLELPQDYWVVLALPHGVVKTATADVYRAFDARDGAAGYEGRRRALLDALAAVGRPRDLAALPRNDLASSPLTRELEELGAFRADVSGAGPTVYGLFLHRRPAREAKAAIARRARVWLTVPAWYF